MKSLIRNPYFLCYAAIFVVSAMLCSFQYHLEAGDILGPLLVLGITFSAIAWIFLRKLTTGLSVKSLFPHEAIVLAGLVLFITFYLAMGTTLVNKLLPASWLINERLFAVIKILKKLLVFVLIPFLIYRKKGFNASDFGFSLNGSYLIPKKQMVAFLVLFVLIILFDYFISGGTKPIREGLFNTRQLVIGIPLVFIAMGIEAGLVEEFFFRALLQSRITQLLQSPVAGILMSGLIFGLAHAPGLYLRGTGADEGLGQHPSVLFCITYCIVVLSSAGFFLGIIWQQTKNIYFVIILHALIDFLPNFPDFIKIWKL